jgi:hypothetical protein
MGLFVGESRAPDSTVFVYYTFSFSVRSELLVEFYLMMAFQILKLTKSGAIPPLILHAFVASIEINLPHCVGYHVSIL